MNLEKIRKCRRELESLRARGGVRGRELRQLAERMNLCIVHSGTHENWGSKDSVFDGLSVFQIPSHPGDLNKYTKNGILNCVEGYLVRLEKKYEEDEKADEKKFDD